MRLIDADALRRLAIPCQFRLGALTDLGVPLYQIDNAPTIDDLSEYSDKLWKKAYERGKAEARKTGHWISLDDWGNCKCSVCQYEENHMLNFCENCGADMRGGRE